MHDPPAQTPSRSPAGLQAAKNERRAQVPAPSFTSLCYACFAVLRSACFASLRSARLRYALLCRAKLGFACCALLRSAVLRFALLGSAQLCFARLCCAVLHLGKLTRQNRPRPFVNFWTEKLTPRPLRLTSTPPAAALAGAAGKTRPQSAQHQRADIAHALAPPH
jgi:hypothetical protein